jgi:hypothetical protein
LHLNELKNSLDGQLGKNGKEKELVQTHPKIKTKYMCWDGVKGARKAWCTCITSSKEHNNEARLRISPPQILAAKSK